VCIHSPFFFVTCCNHIIQRSYGESVVRFRDRLLTMSVLYRCQCCQVSPAPTRAHAGQRSTGGKVSRTYNTDLSALIMIVLTTELC
jgi:hypothetical protein